MQRLRRTLTPTSHSLPQPRLQFKIVVFIAKVQIPLRTKQNCAGPRQSSHPSNQCRLKVSKKRYELSQYILNIESPSSQVRHQPDSDRS